MLRRAVNWLAQKTGKAILKLTDEDYNSHSLQELLSQYGNAYEINLRVFRQLQNTITGWPGGKPPGDGQRAGDAAARAARVPPRRSIPKRILIFSPHPGDDVLSMGGTLLRLAEHKHEVHIAYQVSGSGTVKDEVLQRYLDFHQHVGGETGPPGEFRRASHMKALKAAICRAEARAAARVCQVNPDHLHFLDLPFYEKAGEVYRQVSAEDIEITARLLEQIQPHQIYAAGDLADPHGTHRICLEILAQALRQSSGEGWFAECEAWLYRGAWAQWPIHEVDMAVPLSPAELACKRRAVFQHESQKHQRAVFRWRRPRAGPARRGFRARHQPLIRRARPARLRGDRDVPSVDAGIESGLLRAPEKEGVAVHRGEVSGDFVDAVENEIVGTEKGEDVKELRVGLVGFQESDFRIDGADFSVLEHSTRSLQDFQIESLGVRFQ